MSRAYLFLAGAAAVKKILIFANRSPGSAMVLYGRRVCDAVGYVEDSSRTKRSIQLSDSGIAITGHDSRKKLIIKDGVIQGTVAYMAPERFDGQPRRASDQYSLYWYFVGLNVGHEIQLGLPHLSGIFAPELVGLFFLLISAYLHYR